MATLATLVVDLTANTGEFQKGMSAAQKITKSTTKSIQTIGKAALGIGVAGIAALGFGFVKLAQKAIPAASDLEESLNKVDVVFGDLSEGVKDFASDAATSLGQSQAQALEAVGTYGNLLMSIGVLPEAAADMSTGFVTLASDLASFNNASPEETLLALRSALTGEFEPMKRFGVALSQAAVAQRALDMGLIETTADLTPAIKAQAGYALIMEQTTLAQGDFARTSEGLANSQRIVDAQMEDLMATIGSLLLPVAEKFFGFLSETAMPILTTLAEYFGAVVSGGGDLGDLLKDLPGWLQPIALTIGEVVTAFKDFFGFIQQGSDVLSSLTRLVYDLALAFGASGSEAQNIATTFYNIVIALINFKDRVIELLTPIIEFISNTVTWKDVLIALGIAVAAVIIPAIFGLLAAILPIIAVGAVLIAGVTLIRTAWEENWGGIQEKTAAVIAWFQVSIPAVLKFITNLWDEHGTAIIATVTELWESIKSIIQSTIEIVKTVIGAALKFIMEIWDEHGEQITKAVKAIWDMIKTVFQSAIEIVKNIFAAFAALFKGDWDALGLALTNIWDALWTAIKSIFEATKQVLITAFGIAKTVLGNIWDQLKQALERIWSEAWDSIKAIFENAKTALRTKADDMVKRIKAAFDIDWGALGKSIIDGIKNAIKDGVGGLATAAKNAAKSAFNAFMDFLKGKSPSEKFGEAGRSMMEGIELGMGVTLPHVEDAMKKAAEGLYSVFGDSMLANSPELLEIWNLMWDEISKSSDETLLELGGGYSDFFDIMSDTFRDGYAYIAGETIEIFDYMVTNAGYLSEDIAWIFEAMGIDIGGSIDEMGTSVRDSIEEMGTGIGSSLDETLDNVREFWEDLQEVFDTGRYETFTPGLDLLGVVEYFKTHGVLPPGLVTTQAQWEEIVEYFSRFGINLEPQFEGQYYTQDELASFLTHFITQGVLPPGAVSTQAEFEEIKRYFENFGIFLQHGGGFTVPPGFPNDSFFAPLRLSSGEEVQVKTRSEVGRENKELSQIIVYGGLHLHGVDDKESLADELMELRA